HVGLEAHLAAGKLAQHDLAGEDPPVAAVLGVDAQLGLHRHLALRSFGAPAERARHPPLALAVAVDRRGVDEGQAAVEPEVDRRDGLGLGDVGVAGWVVVRAAAVPQEVRAAKLPASEPDLGRLDAGPTQGSVLHRCLPRLAWPPDYSEVGGQWE